MNLFTKLTYIFALLAMCEFVIGIATQNYLSSYQGSFFQQTLPSIFIGTLTASIVCNLITSILSYVKR